MGLMFISATLEAICCWSISEDDNVLEILEMNTRGII